MSIDDIRAKARPAVKPVTFWLDGETQEAIEALVLERDLLTRPDATEGIERAATKTARLLEIDDELERLEREGRASEQTFLLRAMGAGRWERLLAEHPPRDGRSEVWDPETFPRAVVAECLIGPKLTESEVDELREILTPSQWQALAGAALDLNFRDTNLPKYERRSAPTAASAPKSTTARRTASP